jgi:hypothetical protein
MPKVQKVVVDRWLTSKGDYHYDSEAGAIFAQERIDDDEARRVKNAEEGDEWLRVILWMPLESKDQHGEIAAICPTENEAKKWFKNRCFRRDGDKLAPDGLSITNKTTGHKWVVRQWRLYDAERDG